MARNPKWSREELMLALDLYFRVNPAHSSPQNEEVEKLSALLCRLSSHQLTADPVRFRNPNGVYMKLCNFLRFDPDYHGSGLSRGGKLEEAIWNEFYEDRRRLSRLCDAIAAQSQTTSVAETPRSG
jgi:5-methylcytosine-specific restriction protein A